ncbi:hypothetical protein JW977_03545 [Candidatus Falkowbacteria bacterium]|nr:hypothetical protein [Candidatus Falkowbacteria bacterium]
MLNKKYILSLFVIIFILFFGIKCANAQILPPCTATGDCTLCDMVNVAINIGKFILAIVGSLLLLYFIYGGFTMLISGGNPNQVKKGKDIIINALIGMAIIFLAYFIIAFILVVVSGGEISDPQQWIESKLICPCKSDANCPAGKKCDVQTGECK